MEVVLATNNAHKLREFREILTEFNILSLADAGITHDVVEDEDTFEGNALKKAREISEISGLPTLADDSGLCVEALDGAPGIFSARYSLLKDGHTPLVTHQDNGIDENNNDKLLQKMQNITDRRAKYVCAVCYYSPNSGHITVRGECEGEIAYERKGNGGFGYDTIFYLPELKKHMAELLPNEKHAISHRAKALRKLKELLK